jgi:RHS repeat-associated protein
VRCAARFVCALVTLGTLATVVAAPSQASHPIALAPALSKLHVKVTHDAPSRNPLLNIGRAVPSRWTARSRTYRNANGPGFVSRFFSSAVNFRDTRGKWQAINNRLVRSSNRTLTNAANSFHISLPTFLSGGVIRVAKRSLQVTMRPLGARGRASVRRDRATYASAYAGASLTYQAHSEGLEESISLANRAAQTSFSFALSMSSTLRPSLTRGGAIALRQGKTVRFWLPRPAPSFAQQFAAGVRGHHRNPAAYRLFRVGRVWHVVVRIDRRWLRAQKHFPVVIDPSIIPATQNALCTIWDAYPDSPGCGIGLLGSTWSGTPFPVDHLRTLARFDLSSIPQNAIVTSGNVLLAPLQSSTGAWWYTTAYAVTTPWFNVGGTTGPSWQRPTAGTGPFWTCAGGDHTTNNICAGTAGAQPSPHCQIVMSVPQSGTPSPLPAACSIESDAPALLQSLISGPNANANLGIMFSDIVSLDSTKQNIVNASPLQVNAGMIVSWVPNTGRRGQYTYVDDTVSDHIADSVNVGNGNLDLTQSDLQVPGVGVDLNLGRSYNSLRASQNLSDFKDLAPGWTLNMGRDVYLDATAGAGDACVYHAPDGSVSGVLPYQAPSSDGSDPGVGGGGTVVTGVNPGGDGAGAHWAMYCDVGGNSNYPPSINLDGTTLTYQFNTEFVAGNYATNIVHTLSDIQSGSGATAHSIHFTYTMSGSTPVALQKITDTQGRVFTVATSTGGRITSITAPAPGNGDNTAHSLSYAYSGSVALPSGSSVPELTSYTDMNAGVSQYGYSSTSSPMLTSVTSPAGRVVRFTYDGAGRVTQITHVDADQHTDPTTTFAYNQTAAQTSRQECSAPGTNGCTVVTDPDGDKTIYVLDYQGRVTATIDGLGRIDTTQYGPGSTVTSTVEGASNQADNLAYNSNLALLSDRSPTGSTTSYTYGNTSFPTLPTKIIDTQGHEQDRSYDSFGELTQVAALQSQGGSAGGLTAFSYTSAGLLAGSMTGNQFGCSVTNSAVCSVAYGYDASNNPQSTVYPAAAVAWGGKTPLGNTTRYYDPLGRVIAMVDGRGIADYYAYDRLNRLVAGSSSGVSRGYSYDADGNLTAVGDTGKGNATYTYNSLGRLVSEVVPPGGAAGTTTYTYTPAGRLKTQTDPGGTTSYAYDSAGEITGITDPASSTPIALKYDTTTTSPRGLLTEIDYPDGTKSVRTYDASDRLVRIQDTTSSGGAIQDLTYSYATPTGQPSGLIQKRTDGVSGQTTTYTYDYLNRLTDVLTTTTATGATVQESQYVYDPDGNVTQITNLGPNHVVNSTTAMSYNAYDELVSSSAGPWTSFNYDADGNIITELLGSSTASSLTYNDRGQLSGHDGSSFTEYGEGDDQLITAGNTQLVSDAQGTGSTITPSGATYYTTLPDGTVLDERPTGGTAKYFHSDNHGSTTELTSGTGGAVATYSYDAWGNPTGSTGTDPNRFLYDGGYNAPGYANGLYHFGARFYDPAALRWTQRDAIQDWSYLDGTAASRTSPVDALQDVAQSGAYTYAADDPVNMVDSSGEDGVFDWEADLRTVIQFCWANHPWQIRHNAKFRQSCRDGVLWYSWLIENRLGSCSRTLDAISVVVGAASLPESAVRGVLAVIGVGGGASSFLCNL